MGGLSKDFALKARFTSIPVRNAKTHRCAMRFADVKLSINCIPQHPESSGVQSLARSHVEFRYIHFTRATRDAISIHTC